MNWLDLKNSPAAIDTGGCGPWTLTPPTQAYAGVYSNVEQICPFVSSVTRNFTHERNPGSGSTGSTSHS